MDSDPRSIPNDAAPRAHRPLRGTTPARPIDPPPVSRAIEITPAHPPGWRLTLHLLLPGVILLAFVRRIAEADSAAQIESVLAPGGPLGWLQLALLTGGLVAFALLARKLHSALHVLLALVCLGLVLRGLQDALDGTTVAEFIKDDVWRRAWQATLLFLVIHAWWRRANLRRELHSFTRRAGFWLLFAALLVGGVLGEVLHERDLWRTLARPELTGAARLAMQQLLSLAGMLLLAGAAVEECLQFRGRHAPR